MSNIYERYPELNEPRRHDRAYVHLIRESELRCHDEKLPLKLRSNQIVFVTGRDYLHRVLKRILIERGDWDSILKRGDLIYVEPAMFLNNVSSSHF